MINAVGKPQSILLLGGASDMGLAVVEEFLSRGPARVVLAARGGEDLVAAERRVTAAGASSVETVQFDAVDFDSHPAVFDEIWAGGDIDLAIVAFGVLGDNEQQWHDQRQAVLAAQVNYTGAVSVGVLLAERMTAQGHGQIVAFSSVAGEMVRRSNFVYGSTKAGLDGFYRMLGEALRGTGVNVLVVRPGQVRTNMTRGLDDAPLTVDKSVAAKAVAAGVDNRKPVIWVHPLFRPIMMILKNLPQAVVRRLPL
ncbi:decaprenylphospho-beta-D-erythro-pentofuranosid-2-ulose 2-reductase [Corynebacterium bovis]|uniref:Decaprenylphospho-beta-D-erythro-pentofuranosid-2-ulose 2-reductase n=2 Tax=Corynebacterium bovis TaxID=36808 RepID=A0A3R8PJ93_9CORY|nr:decaprenylphospho-beta-D-erythro-pentofuranosid-2-ulose 2-reductase [Corynebacterium bovis]MBB3115908.1 decaprenylphospho-beta-D-erythro-pentofuranosid-2-ulose 2-reductase [Corynebacterium bovis DSM 20582 = CIP 54.80]MDH2456814.1 decaprenylphospho-beta-D-erythro-pentofuranosid-2-ulose 2-reductase [Corynebacterium bovis]MDK8510879.1 decaprenylphospho-beta-D-erythro-pentofuranosid-2-ulose 2-reductase [Corynebacterium bovis]MDN8579341.1 decaprenylphospho-beta-D-erythro-pentofuranosid-2-ulose 2-